MGGKLLFASLLPLVLRLTVTGFFLSRRESSEQEIHLACFEISGESLLSFYTSKMKIKFSMGILQRELVSVQQFSVQTSRLHCYSFPLSLSVTLKL